MEKIKVAVFDDYGSVIESYKRWLEMEGFEVVVAEKNMGNFLRKVKKGLPDIVLMDIDLPGDEMGGIAAARKITEAVKNSRIIFISHYNEPDIIAAAFNSGAFGYFSKADEMKCLTEAIDKVRSGDFYLSPSALKRFLNAVISNSAVAKSGKKNRYRLTERENRVVQCVAKGMSNKEIAGELNTNEKRIKNVVSNILDKVEAKNRAHAVAKLASAGAIDLAGVK